MHELVEVKSESDWREYHAIRRAVLWEARGRFDYDDKHKDEYLPDNHPLLLKLDGQPIGTTRLDDFGDGKGAVRLVAIASGAQGKSHGRTLAELVEQKARQMGIKTLLVNAAPEALGYYSKLGWEDFVWDKAELTGIAADCRQMRKNLTQQPIMPSP